MLWARAWPAAVLHCFWLLSQPQYTDSKLNCDQHITSIHKRSKESLRVICKLRALSVAPPQLLLLLYKTIIQPSLLYCSPLCLHYADHLQQMQTCHHHIHYTPNTHNRKWQWSPFQSSLHINVIWTEIRAGVSSLLQSQHCCLADYDVCWDVWMYLQWGDCIVFIRMLLCLYVCASVLNWLWKEMSLWVNESHWRWSIVWK